MSRRPCRRDDSGFTLIELVITIAIMGIAFVFILAGMTTSIFVSETPRRHASIEPLLTNLVEQAKRAAYANCATAPVGPQPAGTSVSSYGLSVPTGYTLTVTIKWSDATSSTFSSTGCPPDNGLQDVLLKVDDTTARASESVEFVKRKPT
jgi:prepilin-type N-terminal cleavage/methylation domain-containing protein